MQIFLHSDPNTDGSHLMAEHLDIVVKAAMERFGQRVTRVEAHLSDVDSLAKSSGEDVHCTLEARLIGLEPVIVKDFAGSAHQAIEGALRKLKRAVGTVLARHDPRNQRTPPDAPAIDAASEAEP